MVKSYALKRRMMQLTHVESTFVLHKTVEVIILKSCQKLVYLAHISCADNSYSNCME